MVTGQGRIRPYWQPLIGTIQALPPGVFAERAERARRQHAEDGVTYTVIDEREAHAEWRFDLLPLLIAAEEWEGVAAGVAQRARAIDAIVADIYGAGRLVREKHLPPALLHGNPNFLRAMAGTAIAQPLTLYAVDLMRDAGGAWRVLADRVQNPTGAGYALENRLVLSRTLPEAFRGSHVRRIAPFFEIWQNALGALAPKHRDNPRIVLLTPGPYSHSYFEHVFLARELGITLAQGADLTMRDAAVFLKTLGGLQQVDVIVRRLDDVWCDPLEFRDDSTLGIAGLAEAVRAGNVVVVNALGAAVVESPAMQEFIPGCARALLGEDLRLPSIGTRWLGRGPLPGEAELGHAVVKRAFPAFGDESSFGHDLDAKSRETLAAAIAARPAAFVLQDLAPSAQTPLWSAGGMEPRPFVLRAFAVLANGEAHVMPGGLARVPAGEGSRVTSMRRGAISKDCWVLTTEADDIVVPQRGPSAGIVLKRGGVELQSRVADNLYWLGRYAERLDNGARLLRAALGRIAAGGFGPREMVDLTLLMRLLSERGLVPAQMAAVPADSRALVEGLLMVCGHEGELSRIFDAIQRIVPSVRHRLSVDMWKVVSELMNDARTRLSGASHDVDRMIAAIDNLIGVVAAVGGMASENMTRGGAWRFLDLGRRVERGQFVAGVIQGVLAGPTASGEPGLRLVLELCDSTITYRARYMAALQTVPVLDLVLADESNPRALAYQLVAINQHLDAMPIEPGTRPMSRPEQKLGQEVLARARLYDIEGLAREPEGRVPGLRELLDDIVRLIGQLSEAITRAYFSHVRVGRSVGYGTGPE